MGPQEIVQGFDFARRKGGAGFRAQGLRFWCSGFRRRSGASFWGLRFAGFRNPNQINTWALKTPTQEGFRPQWHPIFGLWTFRVGILH